MIMKNIIIAKELLKCAKEILSIDLNHDHFDKDALEKDVLGKIKEKMKLLKECASKGKNGNLDPEADYTPVQCNSGKCETDIRFFSNSTCNDVQTYMSVEIYVFIKGEGKKQRQEHFRINSTCDKQKNHPNALYTLADHIENTDAAKIAKAVADMGEELYK